MRFWAIFENTFREGLAKKTIWVILILNTIIITFLLLALDVASDTAFLFGIELDEVPDEIVRGIEAAVVGLFYQVAVFIGIFSIVGFFPSMQEKGTIDLLLSRPMSRFNIYTAKFFGCMTVVFLIVAYLILGSWAAIYFKTGIAHIEYLYTIPIFMIAFLAFMAFIALVGVWTRSSATSAVLAIFIPFIFSAIVFGFHQGGQDFLGTGFWYWLFESLYYILPKTVELPSWNIALISGEQLEFALNVNMVIGSTLAFAAVCYFAGALIFQKRSY